MAVIPVVIFSADRRMICLGADARCVVRRVLGGLEMGMPVRKRDRRSRERGTQTGSQSQKPYRPQTDHHSEANRRNSGGRHEAVFVQREGLPAKFLQQFRTAIDALAALAIKVEGHRRKATSRNALMELRKTGIAAVDVLDAIVKPRLTDQPELLAAWNSVKRPTEVGGGASVGVVEADITPVKAA